MSNKRTKAEKLFKDILSMPEDEHKVFTPFALCDEVLDKIPSLDGNILVVANLEFVYTILLRGVGRERVFFATPNDTKAELAEAWGIGGVYKYNNAITKEDVGDMKFDVVVGNPPYQEYDEDGTRPKSHSLWPRFVEGGIDLLNSGGYIAFVTPTSWMSPNNKIFRLFKEYDLRWVLTDVSSRFTAATTASAWCVKKGPYAGTTSINNTIRVNAADVPYLVAGKSLSIHQKVSFDRPNKVGVTQDTTTAHSSYTKRKPERLSKEQTSSHAFPVWHTNRQVLWSSVEPKCLSKKKVVFTTSGYFRPFYDAGTYGVTETSFFVPVNSDAQGNNLLSYLNSKLVHFIVSDAKWSGYLNWNVLKALPAVDLTRSWTDEELYAHFNLTEEEIKLIEDTIK